MKDKPTISIWDGEKNMEEYPDGYILANEGIFEKRSTEWLSHVTKVDNISELEELGRNKVYLQLHMPRIPLRILYQAWSFFRRVHEEHNAEAIVLLCYDEKDGYNIVVPEQTVSGASLDYDTAGCYNIIGTIHSHNTMSAFHSGGDDMDESDMDGIHITLGNVDADSFPSISISMVKNDNRFMFKLHELFDLGEVENEGLDMDEAMTKVKSKSGSYAAGEYGNYDSLYGEPIQTDFRGYSNDDWMDYDKKRNNKKIGDGFDDYLTEHW